ncbi:MAG: hypothetical protein IT372_17085 [Polyangiaceae bacterium]|nr:hypothetical protein [Polyangiaceae bacterium]
MLSAEEARLAAEELLRAQTSAFRYEFREARFLHGRWGVVFAVIGPDLSELDGPVVVLVDPSTGHAEFLSK